MLDWGRAMALLAMIAIQHYGGSAAPRDKNLKQFHFIDQLPRKNAFERLQVTTPVDQSLDLIAILNRSNSDAQETRNSEVNQQRFPSNNHPLLFDWTASCGECNPELCEEPPSNCSTGLIRDACDCCYVCGNLEGTLCDLPNSKFRHGECTQGMVCTPTSTVESDGIPTEGYCACATTTVICGSDGRTYANPCRFKRASGRKRNLTHVHHGPCLAAPRVEIPPMNQSAERGSSAVFSCTASGFPFAWFEWLKDGESVFQPGISDDITVQIRSGPLLYHVTTWLEIKRSQPEHNGFYTCVAKNYLGETNATALLEIVTDKVDVANSYVFRGKHYHFQKKSANRNVKVGNTEQATKLYENETNKITSQFREAGEDGEELKVSIESAMNSTEHDVTVDDVLVETLEDLVKPKEFKDIFFDDDDFSEGSATA